MEIQEEIIAKIGIDMNQFPTVKHLTSSDEISPGNNESVEAKKERKQKAIHTVVNLIIRLCYLILPYVTTTKTRRKKIIFT